MARKAQKLQQFVWEGTDSKGRRLKGDNEAPSAAYVKATLRRQGIKPTKVRKKSKPLFKLGRTVKAKDITFATRQLVTMIGAGIPVAQSIDAIGRGRLYTSLVAAGEQSGTLDVLLEKVATYKEKMEAIKGKIKSALFS